MVEEIRSECSNSNDSELKRDLELEIDAITFDDSELNDLAGIDLEDENEEELLSTDDLVNNVKGMSLFNFYKEKID